MNSQKPNKNRFRFSIATLLVFATLVAIGVGAKVQWDEYQLRKNAGIWIQKELESLKEKRLLFRRQLDTSIFEIRSVPCPVSVSPTDQLKMLTYVARTSSNKRERFCALRLLVQFPKDCQDALKRLCASDVPIDIRNAALICVGVQRKKSDAEFLRKFLGDKEVGATAIDALSLIKSNHHRFHQPVFLDPNDPKGLTPKDERFIDWIVLNAIVDPAFLGSSKLAPYQSPVVAPNLDPVLSHWEPDDEREFTSVMMNSIHRDQRESAARLLADFPYDSYQLRYAEWGVWINAGNNLKLVESVLDEIPEFVHRHTAADEDFMQHYRISIPVTKPIVHLTCDRPLAVQLAVGISFGAPIFAYPKPDSFWNLYPRQKLAATDTLMKGIKDEFAFSELDSSNEYRWLFDGPGYSYQELKDLAKKDNNEYWTRNRGKRNTPYQVKSVQSYSQIGLKWFSMIVSPEKENWMNLPDVSRKYSWWSDLRNVPSSWITSRGETERFLYYDGPTQLPAPFKVEFGSEILSIDSWNNETEISPNWINEFDLSVLFVRAKNRNDAILIDNSGDTLVAYVVPRMDVGDYNLAKLKTLNRNQAEQLLLEMIIENGLSQDEANGLINSWQSGFFEDKGKRLLSIMSRAEYDYYCPMEIAPKPTEIARVGIVLSVLDDENIDAQAARNHLDE